MFFPHEQSDDGSFDYKDFNYTGIVMCGLILLGLIHWNLPESLGGAKHFFIGPRVIETKYLDFQIDTYNTFTQ